METPADRVETADTLTDGVIDRWGQRKLRPLDCDERAAIAAINSPFLDAARRVCDVAQYPDTAWIIHLLCSPKDLAKRHAPQLPDFEVASQAIARIESTAADGSAPRADLRLDEPLRDGLATMWLAHEARQHDPRWRGMRETKLVTAAEVRTWYNDLTAGVRDLRILPHLPIPVAFAQAAASVATWDEWLRARGEIGESFSLLEELVRLRNWPGDQWNSGDDFASAQQRFHRRLAKARRRGRDEVCDRILNRALYLREGLLTDPINPVEWFLAAAAHTARHVEVCLPWSRAHDRLAPPPLDSDARNHPVAIASSPVDVDPRALRWVSGPDQMIDVDEDAVAALPPGCRVYRLVVSHAHPMGPDWMVYWVESDSGDATPYLDLVETAKLHPPVLFISDGQPRDLAACVEPYLDRAFTIPTHPLAAFAR